MDPSELYQEIIRDHARRPRHHGAGAGATQHARVENPSCGDEVELHLRLSSEGVVEEATFTGRGCALSQASASLLTTKVRGLSRPESLALVAQMRRVLAGEALPAAELAALGDLQALQGAAQYPQRVRCVMLAWQALDRALAQPAAPAGA